MNGRETQIGFSQRMRLEWFDQTTNLLLAGNDKALINDSLQHLLRDRVSVGGESVRGNREKVITILLKTWITVPPELEKLRDEGLHILPSLAREDRIAIHWGMALAAYPFWGAVATQAGRLLRLQGTAAAAHVQRRIREEYGERETASRATRRVLRSFIDWGVLNETHDKGVYVQGKQFSIEEPQAYRLDGGGVSPFPFERLRRHKRPAGQSKHLSIPLDPYLSRPLGLPLASLGYPAARTE